MTWNKPCNAATYRAATIDELMSERAAIVVEVGVYSGALSRLINAIPGVSQLTIVDPWRAPYGKFDQAHMDTIAEGVKAWAADFPNNVRVMRIPSHEAAPLFDDESINFWHTDGDHAYEMVKLDIESWLPKVRTGCLLTGDNYESSGVSQAVDELLPRRWLPERAKGRLWCARK